MKASKIIPTGVPGLDSILDGGFPVGQPYLLRGEPGTGKTTLALQFLSQGRGDGEKTLYVTLSQTREALTLIARSLGLSLDGMAVEDAHTIFASRPAPRQTVLETGEFELEQVLTHLRQRIAEIEPQRVVLDSLIDLRLRSADVLSYRRMFLELMDLLTRSGCTVIFIDSNPEYGGDSQIAGLVHGVITLQRALPGYGVAQRRLEINKMRGVSHAEGLHDFTIESTGVRAFPRLSSELDRSQPSLEIVSTGSPVLDDMLGGGLEQGTACMIFGQTGVGKSSLTSLLLSAALSRGEMAAAFLFEEHPKTFVERADGLGLPITASGKSANLVLHDLRAGEVLPGEFVHRVLDAVEENDARLVAIDSVNGYIMASAHKDHAFAQLNTLVTTLRTRQVATVLVMEQAGLLNNSVSDLDVSILADSLILLRQYEPLSNVRRSITVLKRRTGPHSTDMHELVLQGGKLDIRPLSAEEIAELRHVNLLNSRATV